MAERERPNRSIVKKRQREVNNLLARQISEGFPCTVDQDKEEIGNTREKW